VNRSIDILQRLLERFRLTQPLPADIRAHVLATKRRRFVATLRRTGDYTVLFGASAWIFFTLRRFGIGISVTKSAFILTMAALTLAGAVSTGVYFAVVRALPRPGDAFIEKKDEGMISHAPATEQSAVKSAVTDTPPEDPDVVRNRSGVALFTAAGAERDVVLKITDTIARELALLKGSDRIVSLRLGRKKVGRMILGSVEKLEGSYTITARVVGVADSKIISFATENAATRDELEDAGRKIARELARHIE
jgi:hypothetical protein